MIDTTLIAGISGGLCCLACLLLFVVLVTAVLMRAPGEVDPATARRAGQRAAERIGDPPAGGGERDGADADQ